MRNGSLVENDDFSIMICEISNMVKCCWGMRGSRSKVHQEKSGEGRH